VGLKFNYPVIIVELLWVVAFLVFLFILKTTNLSFRIWNPVISLLGLTLIFAAGILRAYWQPHTPNMLVGDAEYYQARVIKTSNDADKRCLVELEWIRVSNTTFRVNDRIQWFQGKNKIKKISPGDRLIVKEAPYAIRPPANPREFDYARYMSRKNIFWQHWIEERDVLKVLPERHFGMAKLLDKIRNELQLLITLNLTKGAPQEITRAMLLGDRSAVSENLLDSFADSGTMHVLAVSGLHLGIVYWLLLKLFGRLRHHKVSKWLFVLICLSVLWGFTLVTGMAPSTQRASIMCSMMLLGNSLSRNSTNSNSLGAAAICILYLDPYQLYSVGFQLSFVALGGILYLYPLIGTIWRP
jgi:competence protein ComEC